MLHLEDSRLPKVEITVKRQKIQFRTKNSAKQRNKRKYLWQGLNGVQEIIMRVHCKNTQGNLPLQQRADF